MTQRVPNTQSPFVLQVGAEEFCVSTNDDDCCAEGLEELSCSGMQMKHGSLLISAHAIPWRLQYASPPPLHSVPLQENVITGFMEEYDLLTVLELEE